MSSWFWSTVWRLHHWDVALSYRIALASNEKQEQTFAYWIALIGAHLGDSWLWALLAAWFWWRARHDRVSDQGQWSIQRKRLIGLWVLNVIMTTLVTLLIKRQVRRTRPSRRQLLYGAGPDVHSFPSGHAARLSTIAVWSNLLLPYGGWLAWPLLLFVGWCRVALGIHYVGDVTAGTVLGGASGLVFRRLWRKE